MTAADEARAEAVKRHSSRLIEDYDGDRYDEDEYGYDATARKAFVEGVEWLMARPISDEQVEAAAKAIFAEEQCDRRQKATAESLENNWLTRLDDHDRDEYRAMARAALEATEGARP